MEHNLPNSEDLEEVPNEEFISANEIEQEVVGVDSMEDEDNILEVDMSNNSRTYFDKHEDSVFVVGHHPRLPLVVSGGGDNVAYLWTSHSEPPKEAGCIKHSESVIGVGFTVDGEYLVTADMNGKVLVHRSSKGGQKWVLFEELQEVDEIVWLKVHPWKKGYFAFGSIDGSVWCYQIDEESKSLVHLMSGYLHSQECTMGEFLDVGNEEDDSLVLVTCSLDSTIVGWNCHTGQSMFKISSSELKGFEAGWVNLSCAPSHMNQGTPIAACGSNNGIMVVFNAITGAVLNLTTVVELKEDQEELDASIESISWSSKTNWMAIGLVSGDILMYDTKTWRLRHKFVLEDSVTKLQFEESTGHNIFASCINGKVYQFDARTGQEVYVCVGHNMGVLDFVLIEQGKKLITAGDEGVSLVFQLP